MSSVVVLVIPMLVLLLLLVAAVVAFVVAVARRPAPAPSQAAEAARRHALGVTIAAWVTLAVLVFLAPFFLVPLVQAAGYTYGGVAYGLGPALVGLLFVAVHAIGELTWPRPTGTVRRAALIPRQLSDAVPTWLHRVVWGWAAALTVTLVTMGFTAVEGHRFSALDSEGVLTTSSPYPGWDYGVPLLVATALVLAATEGVLRLVARRPAVVDADPAYDAASRRLSAHRVLRGAQLVLALTLAGVLVFGGGAIVNAQRMALGTSLWTLGLVVGLAGLVAALIPARPAVRAAPISSSAGYPPPAAASAIATQTEP